MAAGRTKNSYKLVWINPGDFVLTLERDSGPAHSGELRPGPAIINSLRKNYMLLIGYQLK